jgi:HEAT repeat protein
MLKRLMKMLDVEPNESGPVTLLLIISFLMGVFMATFTVASQTFFLEHYDEKTQLPLALAVSGGFGVITTLIFNFFQGRISFSALAVVNLLIVVGLTAFIEFGDTYAARQLEDDNLIYAFGFALVLPFTFVTQLVFWGAFNRMFNVRQSKRIIGSVDLGTMIASIIGFFTIPFVLPYIEVKSLYTISLFAIIGYVILFVILSNRYLAKGKTVIQSEKDIKKLSVTAFLGNKYIVQMSIFIVASFVALRFIDYSFFNATVNQFQSEPKNIPTFLAYFEGTVVIFSFLFTTFATDRIQQEYGLRVALIINPLLLIAFTTIALIVGNTLGYDTSSGESTIVVFFFISIAMSKLFVNSLREALDSPIFKFYYVPLDTSIKIDAQTKIEGFVTALGSAIAGGLIVAINQTDYSSPIWICAFTLPILGVWYWVTNRMYHGYKDTLQGSLVKNKSTVEKDVVREYTLDSVLQKEITSPASNKVIYGLRLMEKLEPAMFESSIIKLADSSERPIRQFALDKIKELGLGERETEMKGLAVKAAGAMDDSDYMAISPDRLQRLAKSVKQSDRILAAKMLRQLTNNKTIFMLLELLRDADPKVRSEALITARKVKRSETWSVLIEMLNSPLYSHLAAAALKEAGEPVLNNLETAFHKSGQSEQVMLKAVQIMGHIGGKHALELLWKKADYPDKRIVKQIFYSLRFINYRAQGREVLAIKDLLDTEMSKTLWNLAALDELPEEDKFSFLREALREEIRDNYDQITLLLSLLYDPESVQLVKENIELGTPDSIQYALELLDLFVDNDLKPKLVPLLDDTATSEKLAKLQIYFPRESYNPVQVINYIFNRDFNLSNRWTKACAVHLTPYMPDFRVSRGLIGQMFNQDRLLQETAAWAIFNKDRAVYQVITDRLPARDKRYLDSSIENNQLLDGLDDGFYLWIEMIMFIKKLPAFKNIPGKLLCDLCDKISPITLQPREKMTVGTLDEVAPVMIVALGEVKLKNEAEEVGILREGQVSGDLFQTDTTVRYTQLEAVQRTVIFRINLIDFYFVMAKHHELVQGLIRNMTEKPTESQPA